MKLHKLDTIMRQSMTEKCKLMFNNSLLIYKKFICINCPISFAKDACVLTVSVLLVL